MARRWCFFRLESEEEINNWVDAIDKVMRPYVKQKYGRLPYGEFGELGDIEELTEQDRHLRDLMTLEGVAEAAEPGQMVVLNKRLYALASSMGALPERIRQIGFRGLEEGVPGGGYSGEREIIPGISEGTQIIMGMKRKLDKLPRPRGEVSRADIEAAIRKFDELRPPFPWE